MRLLLVCVALAAGCKKSRNDSSPPSPPPERVPVGASDPAPAREAGQLVPLVWTVAKDGQTSSVIATLDAGVDVATQVPAAIWERVEAAKNVVLQWNFTEVKLEMLRRTTGTLSTDLTPEEKAKLVAAYGAPFVAELETAKPSFVAQVVSAYGLPTSNPMQAVINQRAQDKGIPTVYLETGAAQQALLDRWLDAGATKALLADMGAVQQANRALLAAYKRGDLAALETMRDQRLPWKTAGKADAALAAMRKATLDERHAAWVATLRPLLLRGNAVVAIDVLDAIGPGGLLELLAADGYTVTRVPP